MSQKKMEAYKEAKKNVKKIRKKEKTRKIVGWIVGILCAAALIAASVFLIYYTNVIKPEQEKAAAQAETDEGNQAVDDVLNIIQNGGSDASSDSTTIDASGAEGIEVSGSEASDDASSESAE